MLAGAASQKLPLSGQLPSRTSAEAVPLRLLGRSASLKKRKLWETSVVEPTPLVCNGDPKTCPACADDP